MALCDLLHKITDQIYYEYDGELVDVHEPIDLRHDRYGFNYKRFSMIGIDCRYAEDAVFTAIARFVREHPEWTDRIIPTYGTFAKSRLLNQYDIDFNAGEWQRGRLIGRPEPGQGFGWSHCHWIENPRDSFEKKIHHPSINYSLKYDANIFKTAAAQAWMTHHGLAGCHTMFDHIHTEMYVNHQCGEKPMSVTIGGIDYEKWKVVSTHSQSEFLDTRTGCEALANYIGIESNL